MPTFGSINITTRAEKGLPLSIGELDANFINLASHLAGLDLTTSLADLTDTQSIVYAATSLLVGTGTAFKEMSLVGDGILSLSGNDVNLKVISMKNEIDSNVSLFYDSIIHDAWVIKSKVTTDNTYKELPVIGFYAVEGTGVAPSNTLTLGSGPGSICYNGDDEILWIRSS